MSRILGVDFFGKYGIIRVMIIAIHQPEFLPYIGFFERMAEADIFVALDDVGYQKNAFINRNRIKTQKGEKWITVPVQGRSPNKKINEVLIDNSQNWALSQLGSIKQAYSKAPHFKEIFGLLEEAFGKKWKKIADLDIYLIEKVNEYLGINTKIVKSSDLNVEGGGTERLIKICKELGADEYLSGPGSDKGHGVEKSEFERQGIKVKIKEFSGKGPYLSIIDLLFNYGPESSNILYNK